MSPWVILIGAVYIGLEWLFASWVAGLIGWTWVIALELGLLALGIVVMRRAGMAAFRSLRATQGRFSSRAHSSHCQGWSPA